MTTKTASTAARRRRASAAAATALTRVLPRAIAMDCAAFERALTASPDPKQLPAPAQAHLALCRDCRDMVDDFAAIAERVRLLALSEPVPDLWPDIRRRLVFEGIIHTRGCGPAMPRLVPRASARRN